MKISRGSRKNFINDITITGLILCLMVILSYSGTFQFFNWKLYDFIVNFNHKTPEHQENVVIACIDQKSIDYFDHNSEISWPWPREYHAHLLSYLHECGAKAVVFDIIFSERDVDRLSASGADSDEYFAETMLTSNITFLAVTGEKRAETQEGRNEEQWSLDNIGFERLSDIPSYTTALYPYDMFVPNARGLGLVNIDPEMDGIHRRYPLASKVGDKYVPSLAFSVAQNILNKTTFQRNVLDNIDKPSIVDNEGKILLNWYGAGDAVDGVFNYYSYHAIIVSSMQKEMGETPLIPPDTFKDKIVIVGSNAPGLLDLKATPFTHLNPYPGLEIHATAIENMLAGEYVSRVPQWVVLLTMIIATIVLFSVDKLVKSLRVFILVFVILIIGELALTYVLSLTNHWIAAVDIFNTTTVVFSGLIISGYFKEGKEKRLIRRNFGRYVNDSVLKDILDNPGKVEFEGRVLTATIMATDIANFTTISEKLSAKVVVSRLNDYLSEVSEKLIDNGAFINKYIGDAILAIYGAFEEPDHQRKACHAALGAADIINRLIEEAEKDGQIPFITRFGLTTGEMTMGNIGSARKLEYTVIGDAVNTAFRLEGLNKFYNTRIIIGEDTWNDAGDEFEFRLLDSICAKGKTTPKRVYELLGVKGNVAPERLRLRDDFEEALKLYQSRRFPEALEIFRRLLAKGDETSDVFVFRCEKFIQEPPPPEWNGVWVMLRK